MKCSLLQRFLRLFPAGVAHSLHLALLRFAGIFPGKWWLRATLAPRTNKLECEVFGVHFSNPIGIAAGFDPEGDYLDELAAAGFGFVEIGSVMPHIQPGTPRPRLHRLKNQRSYLDNSGYPSRGLEHVLGNVRKRTKHTRNLVIGCNIGKCTSTPKSLSSREYLRVFRNMYQYVDYFTINAACNTSAKQFVPRTREELMSLIEPLFEFRRGQLDYRPILLKISPDLTYAEIDTAVEILIETPLDGIVAVAGSTEIMPEKRGAVSGSLLTERAIEVVGYVAEKSHGNYPIIGTGGMMTPKDISRMFEAGASLVALNSGIRENGLKLLRHAVAELETKR